MHKYCIGFIRRTYVVLGFWWRCRIGLVRCADVVSRYMRCADVVCGYVLYMCCMWFVGDDILYSRVVHVLYWVYEVMIYCIHELYMCCIGFMRWWYIVFTSCTCVVLGLWGDDILYSRVVHVLYWVYEVMIYCIHELYMCCIGFVRWWYIVFTSCTCVVLGLWGDDILYSRVVHVVLYVVCEVMIYLFMCRCCIVFLIYSVRVFININLSADTYNLEELRPSDTVPASQWHYLLVDYRAVLWLYDLCSLWC